MGQSTRRRIINLLLNESITPEEAMIELGIRCHEIPLEGQITAFVYLSRRNRYHIFISLRLSPEARREVFLHELYHVIEDMPRVGYILGFDMYREPLEEKANMFAMEIAAGYAVKQGGR